MKGFLKYLMVTVKGICMGAADVIPGVSGGTIAFMTGIYETLVGSINAINLEAVKLLFTGKFRQFWRHINGNFLLSLIAGILISIRTDRPSAKPVSQYIQLMCGLIILVPDFNDFINDGFLSEERLYP